MNYILFLMFRVDTNPNVQSGKSLVIYGDSVADWLNVNFFKCVSQIAR
jgi:hypothetical protein